MAHSSDSLTCGLSLGTKPELPADMLFYQYCDFKKLGIFGYTFFQSSLPLLAQRLPVMKGVNAAGLPPANELFDDMPPFIAVSTKKMGTVISTPLPGMRLITSVPALLAVAGHGFMRKINEQAIKAQDEEQELEKIKEKMKKEDVELF